MPIGTGVSTQMINQSPVAALDRPAAILKKQRQTVIDLGLNKMHKTRELADTPSVRGMVNQITHI